MNRNSFHILKYFVLICAAILSASCEKDSISTPGNHGALPRIVPTVKSVVTKADETGVQGEPISERVVSTADGFELIEMVYNNNFPLPADYLTKGSVVTTDGLSTFSIDAYAEGDWHDNTIASGNDGASDKPYGAGLFFNATSSGSNSAGWSLVQNDGPATPGPDGELYWLNDVPITFWSYNIVKPSRTSAYEASFSYTVNSNVSSQKDPIFAFSKENRKFYENGSQQGDFESQSSTSGASGNDVNIWFYHALSAVQFLKNDNMTDYRISNIEIQNVKNSTVCTITANDNVPGASTSNLSFSHDLTGSSTTNFSQSYDVGDASLVEPGNSTKFKTGDNKTFIMVPQTLNDAKLKVTFTYTGSPASTTSPVFDFTGTWEDGKYYIYRIDLNGNIRVAISENCSSTAKSDVRFQNTCNVNEYIRAAIVANWYDADGNIVAAWDRTRDGDITIGSGWTTGTSDGFYYHNAPVATNEFTSDLIDSFTKPASAPVAGAHFEMTILAQAVCSDGLSSCLTAFQ